MRMKGPTSNSSLQDQLDVLPDRPGVYLFRSSDGEILYVGKAKSLRARVRNYFRGDLAGRNIHGHLDLAFECRVHARPPVMSGIAARWRRTGCVSVAG